MKLPSLSSTAIVLLAAIISVIVCTDGQPAHYSNVDIVHNFLDLNEIQNFLDVPLRLKREGHISAHGVAENIPPALIRRLLNAAGVFKDGLIETFDASSPKKSIKPDSIVSTSIIVTEIYKGATHSHQDHRWDMDRDLVQDKTGFIFLNTNPDAEFVHGEETIPVIAGALVIFAGNVVHNTVVRSGSVRLAGPFHISLTLDAVDELAHSCSNDEDCVDYCPEGCSSQDVCTCSPAWELSSSSSPLHRQSPKEEAVEYRRLRLASSQHSLSSELDAAAENSEHADTLMRRHLSPKKSKSTKANGTKSTKSAKKGAKGVTKVTTPAPAKAKTPAPAAKATTPAPATTPGRALASADRCPGRIGHCNCKC
jgi:hypothetical protein